MRGIRGAITVDENTKEAVWTASQELVEAMLSANGICTEEIGAALFSATEDLTAAFPATGARRIPGFEFVPLFDTRQLAVEESLPMCIRVLLLVDTEKGQKEIRHIYLGGAKKLRPDLQRGDIDVDGKNI